MERLLHGTAAATALRSPDIEGELPSAAETENPTDGLDRTHCPGSAQSDQALGDDEAGGGPVLESGTTTADDQTTTASDPLTSPDSMANSVLNGDQDDSITVTPTKAGLLYIQSTKPHLYRC